MDIEKALDINCIKRGHFKLSSGLHSDTYCQSQNLLRDYRAVNHLAKEIVIQIPNRTVQQTDFIISPAIGAIIIGQKVSELLGLPFLFAERVGGKFELRRDQMIFPGETAIIIEDVITTGGTTNEIKELVEKNYASVIAAGCIIDRGGNCFKSDMPYFSVQQISAKNYTEDSCPMCKEGIPLEAPGSRFK